MGVAHIYEVKMFGKKRIMDGYFSCEHNEGDGGSVGAGIVCMMTYFILKGSALAALAVGGINMAV